MLNLVSFRPVQMFKANNTKHPEKKAANEPKYNEALEDKLCLNIGRELTQDEKKLIKDFVDLLAEEPCGNDIEENYRLEDILYGGGDKLGKLITSPETASAYKKERGRLEKELKDNTPDKYNNLLYVVGIFSPSGKEPVRELIKKEHKTVNNYIDFLAKGLDDDEDDLYALLEYKKDKDIEGLATNQATKQAFQEAVKIKVEDLRINAPDKYSNYIKTTKTFRCYPDDCTSTGETV